MTPDINDVFRKTTSGTRPEPAYLTAQKTEEADQISLNAATGWPTDTAIDFMIFRKDNDNVEVPGTRTTWKGILSGTTVSDMELVAGTNQEYAAGEQSVVVMGPTAEWSSDLITALLAVFEKTGGLKSGLTLDTPTLNTPTISTPPANTARFTGEIAACALKNAPTGWLFCDGAAVSRATFADLFNAIVPSLGAFTVTIASPGVATLTDHGLVTGDAVYITTTGALPTGLAVNTIYYAIKVDDDNFKLATSRANADADTAINTSGGQSGTHTMRFCPYGLGNGSTTFNVPDLKGKVIVGLDSSDTDFDTLGESAGEKEHVLTETEMPSHNHGITNRTSSPNSGTGINVHGTLSAAANIHTDNTGGGAAHNNLQPYAANNYVIKT